MRQRRKSKVFQINGANVILWPNGEDDEIWILPPDTTTWVEAGRYGMRLKPRGVGEHGFALEVTRFTGRQPLTLFGNLEGTWYRFPPKGEPAPDLYTITLVQYNDTEDARKFRLWYEGRGPHPANGKTE
jgi:hypothetical protein